MPSTPPPAFEGLTKEYGVDLLIGETVADLVRATYHLQLVDYVRVKGKKPRHQSPRRPRPKTEPLSDLMTSYLER